MPHRRTLDEAAIRLILTSSASHGALAKQLGIHRSAVSQIRLGRIYRNALPHLPRWTVNLNCGMCLHWEASRSACGLDLPDPITEGLHFARDCACFSHRR